MPILQDVNGDHSFLYMEFHDQISMVNVKLKKVEKFTAESLTVFHMFRWKILSKREAYCTSCPTYMIMEPFMHRVSHKVIAVQEAVFGKYSPKTFSSQVHFILLNEDLFFPEPRFSDSDQLFFA